MSAKFKDTVKQIIAWEVKLGENGYDGWDGIIPRTTEKVNGSWNCWENRDQLEKGDSGDKWFYMVVKG